MFKVMLTQVTAGGEEIGKGVLVENFNTMEDAKKAAEENKLSVNSYFKVNEYKDGVDNIISFDENDTGCVVF